MRLGDRLRFLFAKALESGIPTDRCPEPEVLLDAFEGTLKLEDFNDVLDHIAGCAVCGEAWRLAAFAGGGASDA